MLEIGNLHFLLWVRPTILLQKFSGRVAIMNLLIGGHVELFFLKCLLAILPFSLMSQV